MAKARTTPADSADAAPQEAEASAEGEAETQAQEKQEQEEQPSQVEQGGATAYSVERLIADAEDFLGVPSYVAAGALSTATESHLTIEDAKKQVASFEDQPDTTGEES